MRLIPLLLFVVLTGSAIADESARPSSPAEIAINNGLTFLSKDAQAWKDDHDCASCHHAALVVWAMHEALERGHQVEQEQLKELTKWIAESGDGRTGIPRPADRPKALNTKALSFALALAAVRTPDDATQSGWKQLLETVKSDQADDGSWVSWPDTRPPIFGNSDDSMTALATLALMPSAEQGDETAIAARDKALDWLTRTPTDDDPQSVAIRLIVFQRAARPANEINGLIDRIKQRQNPDGGWSQTAEMPSDAWATGQALYALAHAGLIPDDPVITRGQTFLAGSQREDGSWPMTSRPSKPGGSGADSLIPIIGGGSAWAVLGLVRSSPQRK